MRYHKHHTDLKCFVFIEKTTEIKMVYFYLLVPLPYSINIIIIIVITIITVINSSSVF